jgi:hypothetical protein
MQISKRLERLSFVIVDETSTAQEKLDVARERRVELDHLQEMFEIVTVLFQVRSCLFETARIQVDCGIREACLYYTDGMGAVGSPTLLVDGDTGR